MTTTCTHDGNATDITSIVQTYGGSPLGGTVDRTYNGTGDLTSETIDDGGLDIDTT